MSSISAQDFQRLSGLQYDLTLEVDALSRKYGMSPEQIMAALRSGKSIQSSNPRAIPTCSKQSPTRTPHSASSNFDGRVAF